MLRPDRPLQHSAGRLACSTFRRTPFPPHVFGDVSTRPPPRTSSKCNYQMELRTRCQEERRHFVDVAAITLDALFDARVRAAQDRIMALRVRESSQPEVDIAATGGQRVEPI